jgi:hypothetical protein
MKNLELGVADLNKYSFDKGLELELQSNVYNGSVTGTLVFIISIASGECGLHANGINMEDTSDLVYDGKLITKRVIRNVRSDMKKWN